MMHHDVKRCFALVNKTGRYQQCSFKKKEGDYCGKHLNKKGKRTRVDDYQKMIDILKIIPKIISFDDYLDNKALKDVRLVDVYFTLNKHYTNQQLSNMSQTKLKKKLKSFYNSILITRQNLPKIIILQKNIRKYHQLKKRIQNIINHGPCYYERELCNNQEDFYTLESVDKIPSKYFFSFLDKNGFYYGFDIRSLKELLSNKEFPQNPYSTQLLIPQVIIRINTLIKKLKEQNIQLNIETPSLTHEQTQREKVINVFSSMDLLGYQTNICWFIGLDINEQKNLYRLLEDIWNYRAELTEYEKIEIIPSERENPLFFKPVFEIMESEDYQEIFDINLSICDRLVSESHLLSCRSLGALYILTGLVSVSYEASMAYPDLVQPE